MPFILFFSLLLAGCAHPSKMGKYSSPKEYFNKALHYKEKSNHIKALETLRELRKNFFYSSYNQKALLLMADIYFLQEKYPESAKTYEKHLRLYPYKQTDYVLYQAGLSYKNQLPDRSEHDLRQARQALQAFNRLLALKADSPHKEKARREKQKILGKQADRELKSALFYKTQGWNQASLARIKYFISNYPDSPLMPKALLTGFQLAKLLNKPTADFKQKLIENYPHSKEAKDIL